MNKTKGTGKASAAASRYFGPRLLKLTGAAALFLFMGFGWMVATTNKSR